jgi:D-amino peptidase
MKVFISADIEGVTGASHWDEATKGEQDYTDFREQMTSEVNAACEGALEAGAREIWVKDAHASGRNLIPAKLPREARLVRGWSGHPFSMAQELNESFDASLMVGYHTSAGTAGNPLAHTISGSAAWIKINAELASEFLLHAYAAGTVGVPVVFLSGDEGICQAAQARIPRITTVAVKRGIGGSTVNIHPSLALERIKAGAVSALGGDLQACRISMPAGFSVEIRYRDHAKAFESSFFPGAELADAFTLTFESERYFDVLRLLAFVL